MSSRNPRTFSLAVVPLLLPLGADADVYKYVDPMGHVFYTDRPRHPGYRLVIRTPPAFTTPVKLTFTDKGMAFAGSGLRRHPSAGERSRRRYAGLIETAANRYSLDPELLHAVIRAESGYNPGAVSRKGAIGLMQLMPGTAARYGVDDPYDPEQNVDGGAAYLRDLVSMFPHDLRLAVAAYNAGENNVIKYGNQIPPFRETQDYVSRVLHYYNP